MKEVFNHFKKREERLWNALLSKTPANVYHLWVSIWKIVRADNNHYSNN